MKKFTPKHCHLTFDRQNTANNLENNLIQKLPHKLLAVLGIIMVSSALIPMTANVAVSQGSGQDITKPTPKTPANPIAEKFLGTWKFQASDAEAIMFVFAPDNKLFLYSQQHKKGAEYSYQLDTTKNPIHVDITLKREGTVKTIAELTKDGKLKMQIQDTNPGNQRPEKFSENVSIMDKVSDATSLPADTEMMSSTKSE